MGANTLTQGRNRLCNVRVTAVAGQRTNYTNPETADCCWLLVQRRDRLAI